MASCASCNDKKKTDVTCCGSTVTETTTKVTKTGGALCDMPTGAVQYIGARYVPVFADPVEWTADRPYEHLMMVQHEGSTYISRNYVPVGAELPVDTGVNEYWVLLSNFNAQIESYRAEMERLNQEEVAARESGDETLSDAIAAEATTRANADTSLGTRISNEATARENADTALGTRITNEAATRANADTALGTRITAIEDAEPHLIIIGDSWLNPNVSTRTLRTKIADKLNVKSANVHNYAVSGTGFLKQANPTFAAQLNSAIADTSFNHDHVKYICIMGGTNDYDAGFTAASEYSAAINAIATLIKSNFINAETVVFFMQGKIGRVYPYTLIQTVKRGAKLPVANMAWPISYTRFEDNLHLAEAGEYDAANYVAACFGLGEYNSAEQGTSLTAIVNDAVEGGYINNMSMRQSWDEHSMRTYVYAKFTQTVPENTFNHTIPTTLPCPIDPNNTSYNAFVLNTLGSTTEFRMNASNASVGLRNNTALSGSAAYVGCGHYVW